MLAADVEIADLDGRHWANWFELLTPPRLSSNPRWALLLLQQNRVVKAVLGTAGPGAENVPFAGTSPQALKRLASQLAVDAVVAIDCEIMSAIHREIDGALTMDADFVAQGLVILRVLKKHSGRGLWSTPPLLDLLPAVSYDALQRTFDILIPDATSMVAYVFADGQPRIDASIIAVKQRGDITRVATHAALVAMLSERELAGNWRRSYKRLLQLVTASFAPPSLAVFLERETFYRVAAGPSDQLAREINARNVVLDPTPPWLLGLLSGATMAAFATRGAKVLARFLPPTARQMASGLAQTAQTVMRDSGAHPFALLGFDPIELWFRLRHFYRRQ